MKRVLVLAVLTLAACKKHLPEEAATTYTPAPAPAAEPARPAPTPEVAAVVRNFERVQFELDSATITADGKAALQENAALLAAHPDIQVEIQGHCDERGTTEYNLALGQKRAQAVKRFLGASGASPSRLTVISYGEERPLDANGGEVAWAQNRRAEFRITQGGEAAVVGTVH